MTSEKWIFDKKKREVRQTNSIDEWSRSFEHEDRRVMEIATFGNIEVSTVFLGIDHNHLHSGRPLLFETMVFKNGDGGDEERYSTLEEAEAGHIRRVKEYLRPGVLYIWEKVPYLKKVRKSGNCSRIIEV